MPLRTLSLSIGTVALAFFAPAFAQEQEPQVDLESVDSLLGGDEVAGEQPAPDAPAESAPLRTEDAQPVQEPATEPTDAAAEPAPADASQPPVEAPPPPPPPPEPTDLDRAYAAYSGCTAAAGDALAEQGEAVEVVGVRALAACGDERAAYVNAWYFTLLPQSEGVQEADLRIRAERLVSQTDSFLIATLTEAASGGREPPLPEPRVEEPTE